MSATRQRGYRRLMTTAVAVVGVGALLAGCTGNTPESSGSSGGGNNAASDNDDPGEKVIIGFSAPAADHGWLAAINNAAKAEAEKYDDVDLKVAEGTNDVSPQISQVETFINDKVDAIVLLPFDGAALTAVAHQGDGGRHPGHQRRPRVRQPVRRPRHDPRRQLRHGRLRRHLHLRASWATSPNAVIAEIAGIDSLPLTQDRSQGFADALKDCGLKVDNRVAAEFTVESGEEAASNLLQAAPKIDALWNHDDDQGVGVLAAIENANRDEFFMVGGAGSANAMRSHQGRRLGAQGDGHLPVDPGRRRHQAGPPARAGQGHVRPGRRACRAGSCSTPRS